MLSLKQIQANFIATINDGPDALDPALFSGTNDRIILGLKSHANTISYARLITLEENFPRLRTAIGEPQFNLLSRAYCDTSTARASDANHIGAGFADFLQSQNIAAEYIDLARIEWAWIESYHSNDAEPIHLSDIAALDESAVLALSIATHPACQMVQITASLFSLITELGAIEKGNFILLTRPDNEVRLHAISSAAANLITAAQQKTTLSNLIAIASEQADEAIAQQSILMLIGAGAFVKAG